METTCITQYDTLEELLRGYDNSDSNTPDIPPFPIETEDIKSLDEILLLIEFIRKHNLHNISSKYTKLVQSEEIIREFNTMVGLEEVKAVLATQILSLCTCNNNKLLLNTVLYGAPGSGKSTMIEFLSRLYLQFGVISNGKIVRGDRSNMIEEFVGGTAPKTKALLTSALGGVFIIDEVYQLGHATDGNRCPFAYEAINTLVQFITEHMGEICVIIAGYKEDVKRNFFAQNQGLERRFPWSYTLNQATPSQLYEIFLLQMKRRGLVLGKEKEYCKTIVQEGTYYGEEDSTVNGVAFTDGVLSPGTSFTGKIYRLVDCVTPQFFSQNKELFSFGGGDTKALLDKCEMKHNGRMFSLLKTDNILSGSDFTKGFNLYRTEKESNRGREPPAGMYI